MDSGTIRLGASEMTIHNYLLPRFGRFHEKFPSIKFRIHSCNAAGAVTALKNGELDFAVVLSPIPAEDDFLIHPLASFQDIAAAGPAFSFLKDRLLDLKDLLAYPLICTERGTATREFWEQQFSLYGSALHTDIELPTTDLLCPMAAENLGLALVPEDFAAPFLKNSSLIKLELSCQILPARFLLFKILSTLCLWPVKHFGNSVQKPAPVCRSSPVYLKKQRIYDRMGVSK